MSGAKVSDDARQLGTRTPTYYGEDFNCFDDLDDTFLLTSGAGILRQAAFHRITTPALIDDDDFGIDVRTLLGKGYTPATISQIQPLISNVIQRDERIETCTVVATLKNTTDPNEAILFLDIRCTSSRGPFSLVVRATSQTVEVIGGES